MDQISKLTESFSRFNIDKNNMFPIISIAAAVSVCYASYRKLTYDPTSEKSFKEIPVPGSAYPYVGHMFSLGELPGKTVSDWHKELGPIIRIRMGVKDWVMIDDPVLAHKVFVTKGAETSFRSYSTYAHEYYSHKGKGLGFAIPNERYKLSRSAALSVLAPKHVEKYISTIERESKDLVDRLIQFTKSEGDVNPHKSFRLFSLNTICNTVFGKAFGSIDHPEFIKLDKIVEYSINNLAWEKDLSSFLPILSIYNYFFGSKIEHGNYIKNIRDPFFKRIMKEAAIVEGPNVIKSLAEAEFDLEEDEILVFTSDLLIAATDTTSLVLTWISAIMCNYPDVQKKVTAEIDQFIKENGRTPNFKDRDCMPYCVSVIKESMRLKPTLTFGLGHSSREDVYVDGYRIPKDAAIFSNMESMHMRPDIYPEPEKFKPERFMDNLKTMSAAANGKLENRDHFNFGWGRRICPGIYMAEAELLTAFIQIFSRCYIKPASTGLPNLSSVIKIGLSTIPISYKVKFVERKDLFTI